MDNITPPRRLVVRHTSGPYPGLRQIIGVLTDTGVSYFHTEQFRPWGGNGNGDVLNRVVLWPDGREATLMRMKGNTLYALYQEKK
jgi:hypothetical protein